MNSGLLAGFFVEFKRAVASIDTVTLKSSSDNDRPLCVVSGCSISNFKLGCTLFIIWWKYSIWSVGDGFFYRYHIT